MALCKAVSMFSPPNSVMILEAPLNANGRCAGGRCKLPHGNIDMVVVNPGVDTTSNVGVLIVDGETNQLNLATSTKNQSTIRAVQSRKRACIIDIKSLTPNVDTQKWGWTTCCFNKMVNKRILTKN